MLIRAIKRLFPRFYIIYIARNNSSIIPREQTIVSVGGNASKRNNSGNSNLYPYKFPEAPTHTSRGSRRQSLCDEISSAGILRRATESRPK